LHRCADERGTFLHAEQTKSAPVSIRFGRVKADAVILDDQEDLIGSAFENDFDMSGMRVLGDVVQRLLRDAVQRRLDFRGEALGAQAGGMEFCGDFYPL
jgi:hypothetical protein